MTLVAEPQQRVYVRAVDAQRIALVCAAEALDREGRLLAPALRRQATEQARAAAGRQADDPARWLLLRARLLVPSLFEPAGPVPERLLQRSDPARGLLLPVIACAVVLGLLTNALGPDRQVQILAPPLLAILAWNVAVLALLVLRGVVPRPRFAGRMVRGLARLAKRAIVRSLDPDSGASEHRPNTPDAPAAARVISAWALVGRYLEIWSPAAAPLAYARIERALHAGALALAAGIVGGMYLRGLGFAYQATWESTFLSPSVLQRLLDMVLAPASAVLGIAVPPVAPIEAVQGPALLGAAGRSAAPWIHLWAATVAWVVGVPRALLLAAATWRAVHRRRHLALDLPADTLRRLLSAADPATRRAEIIAYSFRPSASALAALSAQLRDLLGAQAKVNTVTVPYGAECDDASPPSADAQGSNSLGTNSQGTNSPSAAPARCRLLLFSLAQTPEREVHGPWVEAFVHRLEAGQALIAAVDASAFRRRLGAAAGARLDQRRRSWDRVLADAGLAPLQCDLESQEIAPEALIRAAWPAGALDDLRRSG